MKRSLVAGLLMGAALRMHGQTAPKDVEQRAMQDELARSMKQLRLDAASSDPAQTPYFIAYKIVDMDTKYAEGSLGALVSSGENRSRILTVTVRVGDYQLDNSHYLSNSLGATELFGSLFGGVTALPLDDNYDELRRTIWLATDRAYKAAVENLSGKQAALKNTNRTENIADFTKEPARTETQVVPPAPMQLSDAERIVRSCSGVFKTLPLVEGSGVRLDATNSTEHYVNSEGTSFVRQVPQVSFRANATIQLPDGEPLSDSVTEFGASLAELPAEDQLTAESATVATRLTTLEHSRNAKRYNGPVLFEGEAAPELFSRHFAQLLEGRPKAISAGASRLSALVNENSGSMLNKMGSRVLPDTLSVVDSPLKTTAAGHKLYGAYPFDEEGVPAHETTLIDHGILKTLLTSREPVRGIAQSTGNMRERGVEPSNLLMSATRTSTLDELTAQMLELVKTRGLEYGMVVSRMSGNNVLEGFRVYPDGHREQVRNARITELTYNSFRDVLGVSDEQNVYTDRAQSSALLANSPLAGADLVSYVTPSLLFEDVSVEHASSNAAKPPIVPSPLAAAAQ